METQDTVKEQAEEKKGQKIMQERASVKTANDLLYKKASKKYFVGVPAGNKLKVVLKSEYSMPGSKGRPVIKSRLHSLFVRHPRTFEWLQQEGNAEGRKWAEDNGFLS